MGDRRDSNRELPELIDVSDLKSMIRWCTEFKCTDEELRFVVKHYGNVAKDIAAFLYTLQ